VKVKIIQGLFKKDSVMDKEDIGENALPALTYLYRRSVMDSKSF
jgi:hypothetical protein